MGTINQGAIANPSLLGDRYYFSGFPSSQFDLYVDGASGADNGVGNADSPYRTIPRALQEVAFATRDDAFVIHLKGASPHILTEGFVFPPLITARGLGDDIAGQPLGFSRTAPVIIRGEDPTLLQTVNLADIAIQTFDPCTNLVTVVTTLVFVPGALAGKWLVSDSGVLCRIFDNTANSLILCNIGALVAPLRIYSNTAVIQSSNPVAAQSPTIRLRNTDAPYIFERVTIEAPATGFPYGAVQVVGSYAQFIACEIVNGLLVGIELLPDLTPNPARVELIACTADQYLCPTAGSLSVSNSLLDKWEAFFTAAGNMSCVMSGNIFSQPKRLFYDATYNLRAPSFVSFANCRFESSPADALHFSAGSFQVSNCEINGSVAAATRVDYASGFYRNVCGELNAAGLRSDNGAQVEVDALTNVNETFGNELLVGSMPADTWAAFHPVKNRFDVTAVTGQLSRVWEP